MKMTIKIEDLVKRLENCDPPYHESSSKINTQLDRDIGDALEALLVMSATIEKCRAAGFITPEGEVRKVLGRLWTTEDGCILGVDYEGFLFREEICGDIQRCWPSVCINNIDQDYKWYSTPEAARKAGVTMKEKAQ